MLSRYRGSLIHTANLKLADAVHLGTGYGGWTVAPRLIGPASRVYSVGVGNDISFDLAMIERFGCEVHAFDPTPMACAWIAQQNVPALHHFHAIGLSDRDEEVGFAPPLQEGWDSYSLPEAESEQPLTMCPVRRLESLMAMLGHDRIDVLKMDIEGFEYGVIEDVLAGPIRPGQWLIEFHHNMMHFTHDQTRRAVERLRSAGYVLFKVSNVGHEYSFVRRDLLA